MRQNACCFCWYEWKLPTTRTKSCVDLRFSLCIDSTENNPLVYGMPSRSTDLGQGTENRAGENFGCFCMEYMI